MAEALLYKEILLDRLTQLHPFPSENTFDALLQIIQRYLGLKAAAPRGIFSHIQLSTNFILSLSTSLALTSTFPVEQILPAILFRLRKWRVLPDEERLSSAVLRVLASDLAALSNSLDPTPSRMMQIVWIGYPRAVDLNPPTIRRAPTTAVRIRSPSEPVPSHHEMAAFRSGCSACRMPRDPLAKHYHHPSCTNHTSSDTENIPPAVSNNPHPPTTAPPVHPKPNSNIPRPRAATITAAHAAKHTLPRRKTTSANPLPSLSKPALSAPRAVSSISPAVISYPPNKPRPWPLPEPRLTTAVSSKDPLNPLTSTGRLRVTLGRRNVVG
ncbi:hypothetical protein FB451DRAFT_1568189 [Mycena latifolia]|nr:hypothetical protein FB451DRAFT_1568189 [Mycena latifolia]